MKIKHLFLLLASAAFVALSCEKNNENKPEEKDTTPVPEISVITTAFPSIADAGGTLEVTISSNVDWTVSIPEAADWLSANPTSGAAGEEITITFTATANEGYDKRTATVTVSGENKKGSDSEEFAISQKQKDALILSDDVIEVGYEGGTINVVLQANSDISYAIAEDAKSWIVPVQPNAAPTKALVESTISFSVHANTVKEAREGVITFTNAAGNETVTVKQEALPEPDPELAITPAAIADVEVAGAAVKLTLTSNMPWVVSIPDGVNWLTVSPTQGEAGENVEVTVTIQANDANDGRTTDLTFTCTNAENESKEVVIKVTQKGLNIPSNISISSAEELIQFATRFNSGYYDVVADILTVTLAGDITFDAESSAAFNATGGIGMKAGFGDAADHYFSGSFFGNNHSIKGFAATVPLFKATGSESVVRDLVIDKDCSFTFKHPDTGEFDYGAVVGYNKGEIKKVVVKADVALADAEIANNVTALGGIAGRVTVGLVDSCSYSGNLVVPEGFIANTQKVYVGGLVGSMTNAAGRIHASDFEGTLDFAGIVASSDKSNPYLMLGGIVGNVSAGTVSACSTLATNTKDIVMDNGTTYSATIQNHSRKAYHLVQGGIAGYNAGTVSDCTNGASVKNFVLANVTNGGASDDANSRYYDVGGIVGLNAAGATVSGCINNGLFESRSTPRIQKVGGIVGYNKGTVSSCSNADTGDMTFASATGQSPYSLRVGEVGGVIGRNEGDVSNIQNAGDITLSRTENNAGVEMKFGGVIGISLVSIDGGAGKNISNSGNISIGYNPATVTTDGLRFGGIVGSAQASVKNVTNSGKITYTLSAATVMSKLYMGGIAGEIRDTTNVTVSSCVNSGEVNFNVNKKDAAHTDNYVGGILGRTVNAGVAISGCTNSGYIHGGNSTKHNGSTLYLGGITAYLDGASSIANCENNGVLLNDHFSNTVTTAGATFEGGIAGFVLGTAENRIAISNVSNALADGSTTTTGGRRGYNGGIVGYAEYADITGATNSLSYSGGSGYYIGGLAGWLVNATITGSTYSGTVIESTQIQGAGGIVAVLDEGSVLDGCYSHLGTITHGSNACVDGAIAGKSVTGSTIKKCHYKSGLSFGICSDSNFTAGEGEEANKADIE